jgi:subtilisin-like proprotein convertase family protein
MKKTVRFKFGFMLIASLLVLSNRLNAQTFSSSGSTTITDNNCPTQQGNTISVSGLPSVIDGTFGLESVTINITHTFVGDLDVYLEAPNGSQVELTTDNGSSGDNFVNTRFVMSAATLITSIGTGGSYTGNYRPEGNLGTHNNGQNPNGNWVLRFCDDAGGDTGTVTSWSLIFSATPAPPPPPPLSECLGAQVVTLTNNVENCVASQNLTGLSISSTPRPSCWQTGLTYVGDRWYSFIAVGTDISVEARTAAAGTSGGAGLQNGSIALYGGTCTGLNLLNCSFGREGFDAAFGYYNLVPGQTYYLRVSGEAGSGSNTNYSLCIKNNTITTSNAGDCLGAIPICTVTNSFSILSNGEGIYENEINTAYSCTDKEAISTWYTFTAQSTGNFCFIINPDINTDDFDWALFDITSKTCENIATDPSMMVSCNATACGSPGNTGANSASATAPNIQGQGCGNTPPDLSQGNTAFNKVIPVIAGNTYALYISNWSNSTNGYSIDFSCSSAGVLDLTPPSLASVTNPPCGATTITVNFSENVLCSSLAVGNFTMTGPGGTYTLSNLVGTSCAAGGTYSRTYTMNVSPAIITAGNYTLSYTGAARDICSNVTASTTLNFTVTNSINASISGVSSVCSGNSTTLTANGTGTPLTYLWSTGATTQTISANGSGSPYGVTITDNSGCKSAASLFTLNVNNPNATFSYSSSNYCQNGSDPTPTQTQVGTYTANLSGLSINATTGTIDVSASTAGCYTITHAVTVGGCTDTKTANVCIVNTPRIVSSSEICNLAGTQYTISLTIADGDPASYNITATNGVTGTLAGSIWTSNPVNVGTVTTVTVRDVNNCGTATYTSIGNCTAASSCNSTVGCYSNNLAVNGDFEAGNAGFTSNYTYADCPLAASPCTNSGGTPIICQYRYGI